MQAASGDVITAMETEEETVETPPASVTTPADDLTAALSALAGEDLPEVDLRGEAPAPVLTRTTIGVYTVLFTLPSLVVLSAWHAGADSPAYQALLRFGTQVQQNGGQLLDQIAPSSQESDPSPKPLLQRSPSRICTISGDRYCRTCHRRETWAISSAG